MKRFAGLLFLAVMAVFACAGTVSAQMDEPEKGSAELLVGAGYSRPMYFDKSAGYDFLIGGRLRLVPLPEKQLFNRLGILFSMEYTPVSREKFQDPYYGNLLSSESFLVVNPGLSVSVVRRNRFELLLNGGAAFTRNHLSFSVRSYGTWQDICLDLADGVCQSSWSVRGNFGATARIYPTGEKFYVGFDANTMRRYSVVVGFRF